MHAGEKAFRADRSRPRIISPGCSDANTSTKGRLMRTGERIFLYSGLTLALALGAASQSGVGLFPSANATNVNLAPEPAKIATIDILALIDKALMSERYYPARSAKATELNAALEPAGKELMEAEFPLQTTPRESPDWQAKYEAWVPKKQAYDRLQNKLTADFDQFNTSQAVEAYRLVAEAAEAYAKANGYTHVISTRNTRELKSTQSAGVVTEVNSRPIVFGPAAHDISDLIAKELGIDKMAPGAEADMQKNQAPAAPPTEEKKPEEKKSEEPKPEEKKGG